MDHEKGITETKGLLKGGKDSQEYESVDDSWSPKDAETDKENNDKFLSVWTICCILSTSFSYGCIFSTLFLVILPVECERIEVRHPGMPKSIALGIFVAISGVSQLVSPFVGMLSDTYRPPEHFELGQRMPYLVLGGTFCVVGLLGQYIESHQEKWLRYGIFFFTNMIGLNISYAMMIAMIPDQIQHAQTGVANGILAFMLVSGSLAGFGFFHIFFEEHIQDMYGLYICIVTIATIITGLYAHARDVQLNIERGAVVVGGGNQDREKTVLGPCAILKTMLYDPLTQLDSKTLIATYTIDIEKHHDFFVVTVSRLWYYCGVSVQTFFLYFLHDIINVKEDPESAVAYLAVISQLCGSFICYPVGLASDRLFRGRRKPFVYFACALLGAVTLSMVFATTMHQMEILCSVLGAANGMYLTIETSLAVDTLPDEHEDGPSGGHAQLLGIWGVAAFLGSALGPMIGGPLLYLFGHRQEKGYSIEGYTVLFGLSSTYFLISAVSIRWVKNPSV